MSKRWDAVREACGKAIADMGYELAEIEYLKEPDTGWVLTFYIHKAGGVNLQDCEAVSRTIEPIVDELDPSDDAYYLSVSSLGLDRPFKKTRDFERYIGEEIELRFYVPVDLAQLALGEAKDENQSKKAKKKKKTKELHGILRAAAEDHIDIEIDGAVYAIARDSLALARPYLKW